MSKRKERKSAPAGWIVLALSVILMALAMGCGALDRPTALRKWMEEDGRVKVLSTTAMVDSLVELVGGANVDRLTLIIGAMDPHSYELVKGDDEKLRRADILFYNGLGLEHGASLRYGIHVHPHAIEVAELIRRRHPEKILYRDGRADPHLWMDVSLWAAAVDGVVVALADHDPVHKELYEENGIKAKQALLDEHQKIAALLQQVNPERRYLVTSHDAFNYFARRYLATPGEEKTCMWQRRFAAPEGLAPEGQISAVDIQCVIQHLRQYQIDIVFPESNVSQDALRKIVDVCKQEGLPVRIASSFLYGDAMGPEGGSADTYQKMMRHNAHVLYSEWTRSHE